MLFEDLAKLYEQIIEYKRGSPFPYCPSQLSMDMYADK